MGYTYQFTDVPLWLYTCFSSDEWWWSLTRDIQKFRTISVRIFTFSVQQKQLKKDLSAQLFDQVFKLINIGIIVYQLALAIGAMLNADTFT